MLDNEFHGLPVHCKSSYVTMRDGVRLAVSVWLIDEDATSTGTFPALVITTRYWAAMAFEQDDPSLQMNYLGAAYHALRGYRLVVADARGTGASFGSREAETSSLEVEDIGEVLDWAAHQPWCDGRVAVWGVSYTAITALYSLAVAPETMKLSICRAPDYDMYRHLFAPGGIINHWFIETWGRLTAAMDANDTAAAYADGYMLGPGNGKGNRLLGARPVDEDPDGALLDVAVAEHSSNFNIANPGSSVEFIDHFLTDKNPPIFDPVYRAEINRRNIPVIIRCGWHDAGTALGALAMFTSFSNPVHVILGPENHEGTFHVDPFQSGDGTSPEAVSRYVTRVWVADSLDNFFGSPQDGSGEPVTKRPQRLVEYYTLGENSWKTTEKWPLPQTQMQRLYFAENNQLTNTVPQTQKASDLYSVNLEATTGLYNVWHAQSPDYPIYFPDRQDEDKKLIVYDTQPLDKDTEITGHPVVYLYLRSTATDGQFFVYLETIDPDGRVRLLTEGELRGLHRKVSDEAPPYTMFGPYHSLLEKDAQPIIPGEVTEIAFDLLPLSVLLKKGQRIRVAIAGADKDTFEPIACCEAPELTIERNSVYASCIDLPII